MDRTKTPLPRRAKPSTKDYTTQMTNSKIYKGNLETPVMAGCLGAGVYKEMWKGNGFGDNEGRKGPGTVQRRKNAEVG